MKHWKQSLLFMLTSIELKMHKTVKLIGSTKKINRKTKNGENVASLEEFKVVLLKCNLVDNQHQQKSEALYTFFPNKSYAYLLNF